MPKKGLRFTRLRKNILEIIANDARAIGAYDLIEKLSYSGKAIAPISVYRCLDFLEKQGFIHRLESLNAYIVCQHENAHHSPKFLICENCGGIDEVDDEAIVANIENSATKHNFQVRHIVIEIKGICQKCQVILA